MTDFLKREMDDGSIELYDPLEDTEESLTTLPAEGWLPSEIVEMLTRDLGFDIGTVRDDE